MFTVKVIDRSDGKPVEDKKVSVIFEGLFRGCADQCTDVIGEAHFTEDNGTGDIYINGRSVYHGEIAGRIVIYI
jgi:hypothetical protein